MFLIVFGSTFSFHQNGVFFFYFKVPLFGPCVVLGCLGCFVVLEHLVGWAEDCFLRCFGVLGALRLVMAPDIPWGAEVHLPHALQTLIFGR